MIVMVLPAKVGDCAEASGDTSSSAAATNSLRCMTRLLIPGKGIIANLVVQHLHLGRVDTGVDGRAGREVRLAEQMRPVDNEIGACRGEVIADEFTDELAIG